MIDQANKLREMIRKKAETEKKTKHQIKVYSIVSGKGGVGKTNFSVNLAIKFQQMGKRVLILDADIGMSNANILMGIETPRTLLDLLKDDLILKDIIAKGPYKVDLISGGADLFYLEKLDDKKQHEILSNLAELDEYDILIIDNGAGISKQSLTFTILADEIILVTTPEPTALTDAYRVLKAVSTYELKNKIKVVINQVPDMDTGDYAYNKLFKTSEQFLKIDLEKLGYIFSDIRVNKAIMEQLPITIINPNALASTNISQIAEAILGDKEYNYNVSNLKQFKNKLIRLFG
ncbi:P-loop NTPase [Tissierella sp. Yu-01]|uniref:P-loop NTPase n=1 Tax=Tissierella sp. Yu-01 TaxID=3035694 RepID=UPI00240D55A9|nr:P-loop NTPase [Tissierella sp. Yu-01]WFA07881.1 P-loop NTPase [Tissierella sp. Yu-01]